MVTRATTYTRIAKLDIQDVFVAMKNHYDTYNVRSKEFKKRTMVLGYSLKLDSLRLSTFFKRGTTCSCCGLEASYFAVEKHTFGDPKLPPHLNLWGINSKGEEILFTHDHTLARSLGGKDNMSNTTTMCTVCNHKKSIGERDLKELLLQAA